MTFDPDQLAALAACVDEGTFEGAARRLQVTPSAVSQRIRALEQSVGQVLVRRSRPVAATPAGEELVRLAGQVALLTADTWSALRSTVGSDVPGDPRRLALAVNADSLATWFPAALRDLPAGVVVDVRRADQDATAAMLRDGTVLAAVTADRTPVQGCRVRPLGAMRYRAMAAPSFRGRWFPDGPHAGALAVAPVVVFGPDDALQHRFAGRVAGRDGAAPVLAGAPVHRIPSTAGFVAVLAAGVGWGMVPEQEADAHAEAGTLVDVAPGAWLDVPLFWQHWSVRTPTLDDLTARVVAAARALRPGPSHVPPDVPPDVPSNVPSNVTAG
ncbi:putative transcriptional regulator, LysR family protein [Cellulomonas chitinilytica]|uniref:Transcriptional regulator, LysR family protein n=1 Tax=Cellulomonas chitinilytica TaxID=398759 RepID=A0A919P0A7_9CELL|nr:LysR family transcriptional regulator ArgP [Cellulomonas chitinilytica]GIG19468.1 putative transcriptional regulator, LysR family protein [Cellulomonas chitinilytica]